MSASYRPASMSHRHPVVGRPAGPSSMATAASRFGRCLSCLSAFTPKTVQILGASKRYKPSCREARQSPAAAGPCAGVLELVLDGVDTAYFRTFIDRLPHISKAVTIEAVTMTYVSATRLGSTNLYGGYAALLPIEATSRQLLMGEMRRSRAWLSTRLLYSQS